MLIKIGNKIFNIDNVNMVSYTEAANADKQSRLQIIFQRNQYDDTNSIHTLQGADADAFWAKIQTLLAN